MRRIEAKHLLWIAALGGLAWLVLAPHAAAGGSTGPAAQATETTGEVANLLAPVLAAATGIERILEMFWNWFESTARQVVASIGLGRSWAAYAQEEVIAAETELSNLARQAHELRVKISKAPPAAVVPVATIAPAEPDDPTLLAVVVGKIDAAQKKLADTEQQLTNALKSQRYTSIKQSLSMFVGLVLGLMITFATSLDMFKLLNLTTTTTAFGIFITGLVIGAGTGPVHSIIGLIQQSRDAVDQVANLFSSRSIQNATEAYTNLKNSAATAAGSGLESSTRDIGGVPTTAPPQPSLEEIRTIERLARR